MSRPVAPDLTLRPRAGARRPRRARTGDAAMSLIEVVVALSLLASGVVVAVSGFDRVANATAAHSRRAAATALAEREVEVIRSAPYERIGVSSAAPGYVAEFEGAPTVRVTDPVAEPRSTVVLDGVGYQVTRHVTWADVTTPEGTTPGAYKRITVVVEWTQGDRADEVRLDSGVSPLEQPVTCGRRDTDGTGGLVTGVVNRYHTGVESSSPGALALVVEPSGRGTGTIAPGDLVLVVQVGGPGAGTFEYAMATTTVMNGRLGVTGAATAGGLLHGYDAAAGFQVVRVPTYDTATIGAVSALPWDGATGGVVAVDVTGEATMTGSVDLVGDGADGDGGWLLVRASSIAGSATVDASAASGNGGTIAVVTESGGVDGLSLVARGAGGGSGGTVLTSGPRASVDVGAPAPGSTGTASSGTSLDDLPGIGIGVGCRPALTVLVSTSTPQVAQTGAASATYTLTVGAVADRPTATGVTLQGLLRDGLTLAATGAVELTGGATRDAVDDPDLGDAFPGWGTFTMPAGSTVSVTFTAAIDSTVEPGTFEAGAVVRFASAHGASASIYAAAMSTADDVELLAGSCDATWTDEPPAGRIDGIVNTYYPGTASVAAGASSIPVGSPSGASTPIAVGDVLLVIQVQGADIVGANSNDYGDGPGGATASGASDLGAAGRYEYVIATGPVADGRVRVSALGSRGGLVNSYEVAPATAGAGRRTFQVIRVPTYPDAQLGTVTALPWDGTVGGVVAVDVDGHLDLGGGTISASGAGFRGGGAVARSSTSDAIANADGSKGGAKAEGIAGTPRSVVHDGAIVDVGEEGLPGGGSGRGAPGNAGGGGGVGAGGAGGANGGDGGDGGRKPSAGSGGYGGSAVAPDASRVILGGGGGATQLPSAQSNRQGSGGAGGGAVFLRTATMSGTGRLEADGSAGQDGVKWSGGESAPGGGGAGGTVVLASGTTSLPSLTVSARGGEGGDVADSGSSTGAGGGGGGGTVLTATSATSTVTGGDAGHANNAARKAQDGEDGTVTSITASQVVGAPLGPGCRPLLRVSVGVAEDALPNLQGQEVAWTVAVANLGGATATGVTVTGELPSPYEYDRTTAVAVSGGAARTIEVDPSAGASTPAWGSFDLPPGGVLALTFVATPTGAVGPLVEASAWAAGVAGGVAVAGTYASSDGDADDVSFAIGATTVAGASATVGLDASGRRRGDR